MAIPSVYFPMGILHTLLPSVTRSAYPARYGGVPNFPNTRKGQAERLAYYEARRLNHPPNSLLDYHDVIRGRETPPSAGFAKDAPAAAAGRAPGRDQGSA